MLGRFYPGEYVDSTYGIDFKGLYEEGYRGIIFDIDNIFSVFILKLSIKYHSPF